MLIFLYLSGFVSHWAFMGLAYQVLETSKSPDALEATSVPEYDRIKLILTVLTSIFWPISIWVFLAIKLFKVK